MSLDSLRKSNSLDKLLNAVKEDSAPQEKKSYKDDRLWKPELDKSGNGYAVIRFLPSCEGEDLPWAKLWSHAFQGPTGQWYIENSLTTVGGKDPVSEHNTALWNSGIESDKEIARKQKRKLQYYSNIYVVSDSKHPENEGKVFLFRYGKKIFDKIMDVMQPQFPGETPVNPFDFWLGADFQLKIRNVAGYRNYDKSEFKSTSALFDADETKLEATYNQLHDTSEFVAESSYKSYDDLKARLEVVLGQATGAGATAKNDALSQTAETAPMRTAEPKVVQQGAPEPVINEAESDKDTLSYFAKLAAED